MPTDSRTRSLGHLERRAGDAGVRHPARVLDQRLDAAERLAEREHLDQLAHLERGLLAAAQPERHHAAEAAHLRAPRCRGRGARAGPGRAPGDTPGWSTSSSTTRVGVAQCRSIRTPSVLMPRSTSHASNGPATAPIAFWWNASSSPSSASAATSAPPTTSEWPPRYFVVECTTTSAPSASGCCRYGEAKVLSTTSSAPALVRDLGQRRRCRRCRAAGWSASRTRSTFVVGRTAARTASRSAERHRRVLEAPVARAPARPAGTCRRRRRRAGSRDRPGGTPCAAGCPRRPGRWRRPARARRPRARPAPPRARSGSGWRCGCTRSRRAGRRRRPACRSRSGRSAP